VAGSAPNLQFVALAENRSEGGAALSATLFSGARAVETHTATTTRRRAAARSGETAVGELRRVMAGRRIVASHAERVTEALLALGVEPSQPPIDIRELIGAVVPGLAHLPLPRIAADLGAMPANGDAPEPSSIVGRLFLELLGRLTDFDEATLHRVAVLASAAGWSSAPVLLEVALGSGSGELSDTRARLNSDELSFMSHRDRPEPVKPTGSRNDVSSPAIESVLGPSGSLREGNASFEFRPAQLKMSEAVGDALSHDGWMMVEAGTGTGKSLAYLVPAALLAQERGERVVISTNTRALQDQLIGKDAPELERALAAAGQVPATVRALKGRANYLCLRRWFHVERQTSHSAADAGMRAKVRLWLPQTETGDRSEIALAGGEQEAFSAVSAEGEACIPAKCVFQQRNQCFLYRARREAEASHLLVVNHALLMTDLGDEASVLPSFDRLIVDEAHHLEEQATNQFGSSSAEATVVELVERIIRFDGPTLAGALPESATLLTRAADSPEAGEKAAEARERLRAVIDSATAAKSRGSELFGKLRRIVSDTGPADTGFGRSLRVTAAIRSSPDWSDAELAADRLNASLRELEGHLAWYLSQIETARPHNDEDAQLDHFTDAEFELTALLQAAADVSHRVHEQLLDPVTQAIYWIEVASGSERTTMRTAPLHVGKLLQERVYQRMKSVVMTSATLTTDRGFEFMKSRLGFEEAETLALPSPFDYRRAAKLYLVDDIPEPQQPGYQRGVEEALVALATSLEGRTLALFTSYGSLRATYQAIRDELGAEGIEVLAQGMHGSPRQLVERLRAGSGTIVLGTSTFWEGVDVVGPALSALVIAKLPFAVPTDPVFAARSELVDEPFAQYAVPQAVLRFKQGFGRLIRSSRDRGICVVLDRRVLRRQYGRSFIQSLPECTVEVGGRIDVANAAAVWLAEREGG
jgi:DNA polymerase-3 subunit epsilon/ATP-dependent DNA helicase DinG